MVCAILIPVGLAFLRISSATTLLVSGLGRRGLLIRAARLRQLQSQ